MVFFVAITSAQRVGALQALMPVLSYMFVLRDNVVLRSHSKFIRKVVLEFHLNLTSVLLKTTFNTRRKKSFILWKPPELQQHQVI